MIALAFCASGLLCLVPLFYGASRGRFGDGVLWLLASLVVPTVLTVLSWGAIVAAYRSGGITSVGAGGASAIMAFGSLLSSFLVPAYGVSEIVKADKRAKALAATRRRPAGRGGSKRRASGRIKPGVGKAQRARSSRRVQAVEDQVEEPAREPCPRCAELVAVGAMVCRFCGAKLRLSPEEVEEAEIEARLREAKKGLG